MLQAEGGYREACPAGSSLSAGCPAVFAAWGDLFTRTSALAFSVPLLSGVALPYVGPRATVLLLTSVFAAGFALLLASVQGAAPGELRSALILPGVACIATAAAANYLPLLSVASLFKRRSGLALSVLSGSFDTGSGVFLVMRLLHGAGGHLPALLAGFLGGPVLCMLALAIVLWRDAPFQPPPEAPESPRAVLAALAAAGSVQGRSGGAAGAPGAGAAPEAAAGADAEKVVPSAPLALPAPAHFPLLVGLPALPLLQQLRTAEYLGFLLFFAVLALRFNWFLSSFGSQLGSAPLLGAPDDVDAQVRVLGYLMPTLALPAVLVAGYVLGAFGPLAGLALLSSLGTLLSVLQMVPSLPLQGFSAFVFVMFRGTLFSCLSVFLSELFGFGNLSALVGVVTCLSGVFSLLTEPLLQWGLLHGFASPNALILALSVASFAFPWWMAVRGGHAGLLAAVRAQSGRA